jgi:hypothetical protein
MADRSVDFERMLADALQRHASQVRSRTPEAVVAQVLALPSSGRTRPSGRGSLRIVAAFAVVLLAVSGTAAGYAFLSRDSGSRGATAEVNGREYAVAVYRNLNLGPDDVAPYAPLTGFDAGLALQDSTAYAVRGVDPAQILVVKLLPGQVDDGGSYGEYAVLSRGGSRALCPFLDPAHPHTVESCGEEEP